MAKKVKRKNKTGRKRGRSKRVRKRKDNKRGWRDISINDILLFLAGDQRIKEMPCRLEQLARAFRRKWACWHLHLGILSLFFLLVSLSIFLGLRINPHVDKYLPVQVSLTGDLPPGYEVAGTTSLPSGFLVCGPKRKLEALSEIPTEPVDIMGIKESTIKIVRLDLKERGCKIIKIAPVLVGIKLAQEKELTNIPIKIIHFEPSLLQPCLREEKITLVVRGQVELVSSLGPADITVTIDTRNLPYGTYLLTPEVSLPLGVRLVSVTPSAFEVILGSKMVF